MFCVWVCTHGYVFPSICARLCSLGFQVVGGENSGRMDLGTIISSITPGGPADVNGCLKPGRPVFCPPRPSPKLAHYGIFCCPLWWLVVSSFLSCHTCLSSMWVTVVMLMQVTDWSLWMMWTWKGSLMQPRLISFKMLLMTLLWWCHSPKRGSTKVKAGTRVFCKIHGRKYFLLSWTDCNANFSY